MRVHIAIVLFLLALAGCRGGADDRDDLSARPIRVVATTSMIADLARSIGGDRVEVQGMMGPGVDPHLYRPSEGDVARLAGADIVLFNGLHLEGRMGEVLESITARGIAAEAVAEAVPDTLRITSEQFVGSIDPHVWMDPRLWKHVASAMASGFAELDPEHAGDYAARLESYEVRMDSLDAWVRAEIEGVPADRRVLVTAHDAFNYFGRAYGFEVRGLQGISTATEAGTADVQQLAEFVSQRRIPAMFVESSVPPRAIEAVRAAVRSRGHEVEIGGNLFSDALGDAASGADTYEGMIRRNVGTIVAGLRVVQ